MISFITQNVPRSILTEAEELGFGLFYFIKVLNSSVRPEFLSLAVALETVLLVSKDLSFGDV